MQYFRSKLYIYTYLQHVQKLLWLICFYLTAHSFVCAAVLAKFERLISATFVFLCAPIHNALITSSVVLSSVRYFCAIRWSESGMKSMTGL